MRIRNNSNQIQELTVIDRGNPNQSYSIYIMAGKELNLDHGLAILNLNSWVSRGIIQILDKVVKKEETPVAVEEEKPQEPIIPAPEQEEISEETPEEVVSEDSNIEIKDENTEEGQSFFCDICHREFASARSLSNHMSRSHPEFKI